MAPRPDPETTSPPLIPQFFAGREVFITGATGFIGKVLLERLLWTCPEVSKLHLLLRHKKDITPEKRLKELKHSEVFSVIGERCPEQLEKLSVVVGDIIKPQLGLSIRDFHKLSQVSVVFHSAATLKFDEPLGLAVEQNLRSVLKVMEICDQLPIVEVLVYVSTAYSNADLPDVEEKTYPAPVPLPQLLAIVDNLPQHLLSEITPDLISPKPNTYTFTKAMAESALQERAHLSKYATAIFKPSIVISSIQNPFPGWIENLNGPSGVIVGIGKGFLHVFDSISDMKADMIPVDIVIDTMIAVAWETGLENSREPRVYNCCSHDNPTTWGYFKARMIRGVRTYPFDNPLWYPWGYITNNNRLVMKVAPWVFHAAPLHTLNLLCKMFGIIMRPCLATVCYRLRAMNDALRFFAVREWKFSTSNVQRLRDRLAPADAAIYNLDVQTIDWDDLVVKFVVGTRRYLLREPDKNIQAARARMRLLYAVHRGIQCIVAFCILSFLAMLL